MITDETKEKFGVVSVRSRLRERGYFTRLRKIYPMKKNELSDK